MPQLRLGQKIEVDLFGMRVSGIGDVAAVGTVVALNPGVITVSLERRM